MYILKSISTIAHWRIKPKFVCETFRKKGFPTIKWFVLKKHLLLSIMKILVLLTALNACLLNKQTEPKLIMI